MDSLLNVSRRGLVKWGLAAAGIPMLTNAFGSNALAQDAGGEGGKKGAIGGRADEELYTGKGLQGGGQLEIQRRRLPGIGQLEMDYVSDLIE